MNPNSEMELGIFANFKRQQHFEGILYKIYLMNILETKLFKSPLTYF